VTHYRERVHLLRSRILEILGSDSFAYSALHMSLVLFIFGAWSFATPDAFSENRGTDVMELIASSFTWGVVGMILAGMKITYLIDKCYEKLSMLSIVSAYYWFLVGVSFIIDKPTSAAGPLFMMLGLYEVWLYRKLSSR
jgi:hypothetical protein